MSKRSNYQQFHNEPGGRPAMVVSVAEALWRLRIAPTAADLVRLLPPEALLDDDLVDLTRCSEPA